MKNRFYSLLLLVALVLCIFASPKANAQATVYNQPANPIAQLVGGPGAQANIPTFAATMTISPIANGVLNAVTQLSGVSTTSSTCTLNAAAIGSFGQIWITICSASSSGTVTYTFGTNFLPTATVAATASKSITVMWVSDGVLSWHEVCRSASAQ